MRVFLCATLVIATISTVATAQVAEVANYAALRGYALSATNVNVDGRLSNNDGGGGEFVQNGTVGTNCNTTDDDGGVVIVGSTRCWYRQFTGPVHLAWYGVPDVSDSTSTCFTYNMPTSSCDATTGITNAFAASAKYGDGGVTTDGRSVAILRQCGTCAAAAAHLPLTPPSPWGSCLPAT